MSWSLGVWIGPGNELGAPIPIGEAAEHMAGFCLLNDWSARDIQAWEYQPLGPFLSKNFGTTISSWVVTPEALAPVPHCRSHRAPRAIRAASVPAGRRPTSGKERLNVELEVLLLTPGLQGEGLTAASAGPEQYALHVLDRRADGGASHLQRLQPAPGDLLGSGTISAPDESGCGSLLETTEGGKAPVRLASGEERRFLEDGDEVILRARARREGFASDRLRRLPRGRSGLRLSRLVRAHLGGVL